MRQGVGWLGVARLGKVWQAWMGRAWHGGSWRGWHGPDWQAWSVTVWLGRVWSGAARWDKAWPGLAGRAGMGQDGRGRVLHGPATQVLQCDLVLTIGEIYHGSCSEESYRGAKWRKPC